MSFGCSRLDSSTVLELLRERSLALTEPAAGGELVGEVRRAEPAASAASADPG